MQRLWQGRPGESQGCVPNQASQMRAGAVQRVEMLGQPSPHSLATAAHTYPPHAPRTPERGGVFWRLNSWGEKKRPAGFISLGPTKHFQMTFNWRWWWCLHCGHKGAVVKHVSTHTHMHTHTWAVCQRSFHAEAWPAAGPFRFPLAPEQPAKPQE